MPPAVTIALKVVTMDKNLNAIQYESTSTKRDAVVIKPLNLEGGQW